MNPKLIWLELKEKTEAEVGKALHREWEREREEAHVHINISVNMRLDKVEMIPILAQLTTDCVWFDLNSVFIA